MLVGYARTSTAEQTNGLEAQEDALKSAKCEKVFKEQVSSVAARGQLDAALDYVREGDTLIVTKLDRLARSTRHALEIVETLERKKAGLCILDFGGQALNTKSAQGKLTLTMFAAFAQFERETMLERQREGIAKAKHQGKYKGRKPTAREKAEEVLRLKDEGRSPTDIAKTLKIGRASVYRVLAASA